MWGLHAGHLHATVDAWLGERLPAGRRTGLAVADALWSGFARDLVPAASHQWTEAHPGTEAPWSLPLGLAVAAVLPLSVLPRLLPRALAVAAVLPRLDPGSDGVAAARAGALRARSQLALECAIAYGCGWTPPWWPGPPAPAPDFAAWPRPFELLQAAMAHVLRRTLFRGVSRGGLRSLAEVRGFDETAGNVVLRPLRGQVGGGERAGPRAGLRRRTARPAPDDDGVGAWTRAAPVRPLLLRWATLGEVQVLAGPFALQFALGGCACGRHVQGCPALRRADGGGHAAPPQVPGRECPCCRPEHRLAEWDPLAAGRAPRSLENFMERALRGGFGHGIRGGEFRDSMVRGWALQELDLHVDSVEFRECPSGCQDCSCGRRGCAEPAGPKHRRKAHRFEGTACDRCRAAADPQRTRRVEVRNWIFLPSFGPYRYLRVRRFRCHGPRAGGACGNLYPVGSAACPLDGGHPGGAHALRAQPVTLWALAVGLARRPDPVPEDGDGRTGPSVEDLPDPGAEDGPSIDLRLVLARVRAALEDWTGYGALADLAREMGAGGLTTWSAARRAAERLERSPLLRDAEAEVRDALASEGEDAPPAVVRALLLWMLGEEAGGDG